MRFESTAVAGAFMVLPEVLEDLRGSFARIACNSEFAELGLEGPFVQINVTWNERAGTLRGLHVQRAPFGEAKLVRCIRGSIFDVGLDVRDDSPTRGAIVTATLTARAGAMLFLPPGCAHGYQALEDDTEVMTFHSAFYAPEAEAGFRWDDPAFAIPWPIPEPTLSEKDSGHPYR